MFTLLDSTDQIKPGKDTYLAVITSEISSKEDLLEELKNKLQFPEYFGFNWDALFDCLKDLDWIKKKKVVIAHNDLPKLDNKDLMIYIGILEDAIRSWSNDRRHSLDVVFPKSEEKQLRKLLSKIAEETVFGSELY